MRYSKLAIVALLFTGFLSFNFTYSSDQFFKTNLRITIQDDLGNVQEGAEVTLYENNDDYRASENAIAGTLKTDKRGRVTFKDLKEKQYFVQAEKGDMNNYGLGIKTDTLEGGKLNRTAIIIQ